MPIKYTPKQKEERIKLLSAKITIAKAEGDTQKLKKLQNLRRNAKSRF